MMMARTLFASSVNTLDQRPLVIALERFQVDTGSISHARQRHVDVGEGDPAIMFRLAGAQQVQIGAVQNQDSGLFSRLEGDFASS